MKSPSTICPGGAQTESGSIHVSSKIHGADNIATNSPVVHAATNIGIFIFSTKGGKDTGLYKAGGNIIIRSANKPFPQSTCSQTVI